MAAKLAEARMGSSGKRKLLERLGRRWREIEDGVDEGRHGMTEAEADG